MRTGRRVKGIAAAMAGVLALPVLAGDVGGKPQHELIATLDPFYT